MPRSARAARARAPPGRRSGSSAAGDRGQDVELGALGDLGLEAVEEADVLAGHVDVDEAPQLAVVAAQAVAQRVVLAVERLEHLADGAALAADLGLAAGRVAQLGRQLDGDRHYAATPTAALN